MTIKGTQLKIQLKVHNYLSLPSSGRCVFGPTEEGGWGSGGGCEAGERLGLEVDDGGRISGGDDVGRIYVEPGGNAEIMVQGPLGTSDGAAGGGNPGGAEQA